MLENLNKYKIILVSASPRRQELLRGMGIDFTVRPVDVEETYPPGLSPENTSIYLSRLKADAFPLRELTSGTLIITADTLVVKDGEMLGKPTDNANALEMLGKLSGTWHEVITGICLRSGLKERCFAETTRVFFRKLSLAELEYYVSRYKPFDKAGAYGIQEWIGYIATEKIEGSYFNVMGLPTQALYAELAGF